MRLFLDTEWQNDVSRELVSVALLGHDGRHRFYAERDPLPSAPSTFVHDAIYPLLNRGSAAMPDMAFAIALREFLAQLDDPLIVADSPIDFRPLSNALDGFRSAFQSPHPPWRKMLALHEDVQTRIEIYFDSSPSARVRRHHALADTEALRWAFEGVAKTATGG